MGDWNERDHPRDPENGRFTDRPGSGGWARRISNAIGTGHGTPREKAEAQLHKLYDDLGIHERDSITEYLDAVGEPSTPLSDHDLDFALAGHAAYAEDTDLPRLAGAVDRTRFPTAAAHLDQEMQLRGGGSYYEPAAPEPAPVDPDIQQRREDVLDALNPEAAFRRKAEPLLRQIYGPHPEWGDPGISDQQIDQYIRESLPRSAPITDENLDDMLMNILSLADESGYQDMDDGLTNVDDWMNRFPGTYERISDFFKHNDDPDYEGY